MPASPDGGALRPVAIPGADDPRFLLMTSAGFLIISIVAAYVHLLHYMQHRMPGED